MLPGRYFQLLDDGLRSKGIAEWTALSARRHFASTMLAAAVLYAVKHPANKRHGDGAALAFATKVGDAVTEASERGAYDDWPDHHRDTYMWLETYRLLEPHLGASRIERWARELRRHIGTLALETAKRQDFPLYQSPYIRTSPNHYSLWASTTQLAGRVFKNKEWEELGTKVMHRFAAEEQSPDGYWGEHSSSGPTPGYDYLTMTAVALFWEHSKDEAAHRALRRSTDFHKWFTYPDGTPAEVINDRNRRWGVSAWGHFGFSHFPDGRRYAELLTRFLAEDSLNPETLGRIAQNALYYHEGPVTAIPQDAQSSQHQMSVPAGIRTAGPWVICLSGLISTQAADSQFYLDRQGHVSIYHDKTGLIVTGANSKRQPELATFWEKHIGQLFHLPMSSRLRMQDSGDRLGLSYHTFFAELSVPPPTPKSTVLRFAITGKGRPPQEAELTLQLCLKAGEKIEAATGSWTLGKENLRIEGGNGGWIRHHGWTIRVNAQTRLSWPVYPFNPYANGPETDIAHAVGALAVPLTLKGGAGLRPNEQQIELSVEVP